jgi:hypothetical protein
MASSPEFSDEALTEEVNTHNVQAITSPVRASDGKYIVINPEDLIVEVTEYNVDFNKENFDIEVYVSGNIYPGGLFALRFNNDPEATYQNGDVEYYLNLNADNEISNELLKQANIKDFTALGTEPGARAVSTREYFIRKLYEPEEEICE